MGPVSTAAALGAPHSDREMLAALVDASRSLSGTLELEEGLAAVLEGLGARLGSLRSFVVLTSPSGEELRVEAASGLPVEGWATRHRLGDGLAATVLKEGRPRVVPRISQEPRVLHRVGAPDEEASLVCVPIPSDGRAEGALTVCLRFDPARDLDATQELLAVIAAMMGQAARVSWLAEAERQHLVEENSQLREELLERSTYAGLVGASGPMRDLYAQIAQVARTHAPVLVRGESGTGKERIAHAIHLSSPRAAGPYLTVHCGALPPALVESELFGHESGAFPGAHGRKAGVIERAHGGTLFLDEVSDFDPSLQVKLLRVLHRREIQRVGGTEPVAVDVRVIAATQRDLEQAMAGGRFREDLYYQLNVFAIYVPPLRERKDDILALAEHFVEKHAAEYGKRIGRISTPAIDMLARYHWPGNVRELENAIVRAVLVCDEEVIHAHHLPPTLQTAEASNTVRRGSLSDLVGTFERSLIEDTLKTTRGSRVQAARLLETTERILNYRIRRYGIDCRRFR